MVIVKARMIDQQLFLVVKEGGRTFSYTWAPLDAKESMSAFQARILRETVLLVQAETARVETTLPIEGRTIMPDWSLSPQ